MAAKKPKKSTAALPESFTEYLRRVARDFQATEDTYGNDEQSPTAKDYIDAANCIDELIAACERADRAAWGDYSWLDEMKAAVKKAKTTP